ncbi:hypothetical protein [Sulfuricurvum sp.]|uniref:hypothetical protein n=1 Tax=Sulfuricurvum sp. TaxID=2025608 RepID=UPI00261B6C30|nr:hypothetical protein [Sulfuricurvum sp.]MDD2781779.1 hypothetical protein [Sulfuricurvum sp.]
MAKSDIQKKHTDKLAEQKKNKTIWLVEESCKWAISNHERGASNRRLAAISKLVDPEKKGLSNATFSASHVQELLIAYGMSKYIGLPNEGVIDAGMYLELQKELAHANQEIKKLKDKIKKLNNENKELILKNEVLRHDNMGLLSRIDSSGLNLVANNIKHSFNSLT